MIALPSTFLAHTIPEAALNWAHMKKIAGQVMPYRDDVEVGLPIGSIVHTPLCPEK